LLGPGGYEDVDRNSSILAVVAGGFFGAGVSLSHVTIELTDAPVTAMSKIGLAWLKEKDAKIKILKGSRNG